MHTVKEVAERCGRVECSVRKAAGKLYAGGMIGPRKGRDWLFDDRELDVVVGALVGRGRGRKGRGPVGDATVEPSFETDHRETTLF